LPRGITWQVQKNHEQMEQEFSNPDQWTLTTSKQILGNILLSVIRHGKIKESCQGKTADNIQVVARYISEHFAVIKSFHQLHIERKLLT